MKIITVQKAQNRREKTMGLIGKKQAYPLLLQTRFGIHTFGVRFPIDVIILNNRHEVVSTYKNMKPNRIFLWNPVYQLVLELPSGTIENTKLEIGNKIKLVIK